MSKWLQRDGYHYHPSARIGEDAWIGQGAWIGNAVIEKGAVIGRNAAIGEDARIGQGAAIGKGAAIGQDAVIEKGAAIGQYAVIGKGAWIGQYAVIGKYAVIGQGAVIWKGAEIGGYISGYTWDAWTDAGRAVWVRYGCVVLAATEWEISHETLARRHAPGEVDHYAAVTRLVVEIATRHLAAAARAGAAD